MPAVRASSIKTWIAYSIRARVITAGWAAGDAANVVGRASGDGHQPGPQVPHFGQVNGSSPSARPPVSRLRPPPRNRGSGGPPEDGGGMRFPVGLRETADQLHPDLPLTGSANRPPGPSQNDLRDLEPPPATRMRHASNARGASGHHSVEPVRLRPMQTAVATSADREAAVQPSRDGRVVLSPRAGVGRSRGSADSLVRSPRTESVLRRSAVAGSSSRPPRGR